MVQWELSNASPGNFVSFFKPRRLGSCQTEINRCREHNIQGHEVVKMRNSNINVRRRGRSLSGVRRQTWTLLHIHQEPSGCHGEGECLQYMTVQTCHVSPISEFPILTARFPSTVRGDHENGKKKSRNQLGRTYDKNEKYLFGEDSVSFVHKFLLHFILS